MSDAWRGSVCANYCGGLPCAEIGGCSLAAERAGVNPFAEANRIAREAQDRVNQEREPKRLIEFPTAKREGQE